MSELNHDSLMRADELIADIDSGLENLLLVGHGRDACGFEADATSAISFAVRKMKDDINELRKVLKIDIEE